MSRLCTLATAQKMCLCMQLTLSTLSRSVNTVTVGEELVDIISHSYNMP